MEPFGTLLVIVIAVVVTAVLIVWFRRLNRPQASKVHLAPPDLVREVTSADVGILFDIDELEGGYYGWKAYSALFLILDPDRLKNSALFDGDTAATLSGHARQYCIAIRGLDDRAAAYVRKAFRDASLPNGSELHVSFVDAVSQEPLVFAARIDQDGRMRLPSSSFIQPGWTEGTRWRAVVDS